MQKWNILYIKVKSVQGKRSTYGIVQRTEPDRAADGNRLGGGRNLIGRRTQSDWAADGNRRRCAAHRCTNKANRESVPQNTQNTQNLLAEKASHR